MHKDIYLNVLKCLEEHTIYIEDKHKEKYVECITICYEMLHRNLENVLIWNLTCISDINEVSHLLLTVLNACLNRYNKQAFLNIIEHDTRTDLNKFIDNTKLKEIINGIL